MIATFSRTYFHVFIFKYFTNFLIPKASWHPEKYIKQIFNIINTKIKLRQKLFHLEINQYCAITVLENWIEKVALLQEELMWKRKFSWALLFIYKIWVYDHAHGIERVVIIIEAIKMLMGYCNHNSNNKTIWNSL